MGEKGQQPFLGISWLLAFSGFENFSIKNGFELVGKGRCISAAGGAAVETTRARALFERNSPHICVSWHQKNCNYSALINSFHYSNTKYIYIMSART